MTANEADLMILLALLALLATAVAASALHDAWKRTREVDNEHTTNKKEH